MKYAPFGLVALLILAGCTVQTDHREPALAGTSAIVPSPSKELTAELQGVIARLLKQKKVLVSPQAFTMQSLLTLERAAYKPANGVINGRIRERPWQVELIRQQQRCFVKNLETGEQLPLRYTDCRSR